MYEAVSHPQFFFFFLKKPPPPPPPPHFFFFFFFFFFFLQPGETLEGTITCKPNDRNHRDLDFHIEVQVRGSSDLLYFYS